MKFEVNVRHFNFKTWRAPLNVKTFFKIPIISDVMHRVSLTCYENQQKML